MCSCRCHIAHAVDKQLPYSCTLCIHIFSNSCISLSLRFLLSVIRDTPVLHNSIFHSSVCIIVLFEPLALGCDLLNQLLQDAVWYVWHAEQYHHAFVVMSDSPSVLEHKVLCIPYPNSTVYSLDAKSIFRPPLCANIVSPCIQLLSGGI